MKKKPNERNEAKERNKRRIANQEHIKYKLRYIASAEPILYADCVNATNSSLIALLIS